jgi:hypothetical protein
MGLFGGKKTHVSSVVYNMAGPEIDRVQFLKTTVVGSVLTAGRDFSISETLQNSLLSGPGMKARVWHRWASNPDNNFRPIGMPTMKITSAFGYDYNDVKAQITPESGVIFEVASVRFGSMEFTYWAEQWILVNQPTRINTNYVASYNETTGEISIDWEDPAHTTSTFAPVGLDRDAHYAYITYNRKTSTAVLNPRIWIYQIGSGNAVIDAMQSEQIDSGEFIPFIPVRLNNQFLSSTFKAPTYEIVKKAYKKATGQKFDDLVEKIADNDAIDDIDFTYMVYGVPLNTKDNSARKYLFKFFELLGGYQEYDSSTYDAYQAAMAQYEEDLITWQDGREAAWDPEDPDTRGGWRDYSITNPMPQPPATAARPVSEVVFKNSGTTDGNLHLIINWGTITKTSGSGLKDPARKKGELWWSAPFGSTTNDGLLNLPGFGIFFQFENVDVTLSWQITDDYWESLTITDLHFKNLVYNGQAVNLHAIQELDPDVVDEESPFIIPIHYETMKSMSLVDSTQMMTAGTFLVFNCYEVVKTKWYQSIAFKIFIFIVMIAIVVIFPPSAPGLLGMNAAVGAALGFTGVMAAIAGAIANALAAMLLMQLISLGATAVFGAKIGAIVAAVASVMAMSMGGPMLNGSSMAASWGNMMSAVNIINMTSAVGSGIAGYMQASTMDYAQKYAKLMEDYQEKSKLYEEMYLKEFGEIQTLRRDVPEGIRKRQLRLRSNVSHRISRGTP